MRYNELAQSVQADMVILMSRLLYANYIEVRDWLENENPEVYEFLLSYRINPYALKQLIIYLSNKNALFDGKNVRSTLAERERPQGLSKGLQGSFSM